VAFPGDLFLGEGRASSKFWWSSANPPDGPDDRKTPSRARRPHGQGTPSRCCASCEGVEALAGARGLGSLTELNLGGQRLGVAGVTALAGAPWAAGLTVLRLDSCVLSDEGALVLARSRRLTNLAALDLSCNVIGPAGARALASSRHLARLGRPTG
jgi:hypothetical protein